MKLLVSLFMLATLSLQHMENPVKTQATITEIDSKISGRHAHVTAKVQYTTETGDTINSQVRLFYMPFIGALKNVGDTINITYDKTNPYLAESADDSFLSKYGLYILIALGIIITLYRFKNRA